MKTIFALIRTPIFLKTTLLGAMHWSNLGT